MQHPAPAIDLNDQVQTRLLPPLNRRALLALIAASVLLVLACSSLDHEPGPRQGTGESPGSPDLAKTQTAPLDRPDEPDIYEEVWSQTSPRGSGYEFKVNCASDAETLEPCYLSDLTSVQVTGPDGVIYQLDKDFNINDYSGEVTRRWVLYGPEEGLLPVSGMYTFEYLRAGELVRSHAIDYSQSQISYPTAVELNRVGGDIAVTWDPPSGVEEGMWYKVIIWAEYGTPDVFVSQIFDWDARTATLPDVPLLDEGTYSLNVAVFYNGGYAYSEYEIFDW